MLAQLLDEKHQVECVSFEYGSKHNQYENQAAIDIANWYRIPLLPINLSQVMSSFRSNLLLSGGPIPEGNYTDASMASTVVPCRNIIFLSILAGLAWSKDAQAIAIGIHQGDHAVYDDCRTEFFKAMDTAIYLGSGRRVEITAPFIRLDKAGIVKRGLELHIPYNLTRTCYKAQELACGKCGSCAERLEAFILNGEVDPIQYER